MKIIATTLICLLFCSPSLAQIQKTVTKQGGYIYYGSYQPQNLKSLDELPVFVRIRLIKHLQQRLGDSFFQRLRFTDGQVVNLKELYRVDPNARNYQWEVPAYDLHFTFSDANAGLDLYTAEIQLRWHGGVLKEIDLPSFAEHPEKATLQPLSDAAKRAAEKGYEMRRTAADIIYDPETDALRWKFSEYPEKHYGFFIIRCIEIDAHTGQVEKEYEVGANGGDA